MGGEAVGNGLAKLLVLLALVPVLALPLAAQTKDQPDQGFGPIDTSAPAKPPDQIVKEFAAKESEFRLALDNYTYQRDVRIQTINDDGKPDGEYRQVVQITFDSQGREIGACDLRAAEYVGTHSDDAGRCFRYRAAPAVCADH